MKDEFTYESTSPPTMIDDVSALRPNMTYDTGPQLPVADQPITVTETGSSE